MRVTNDIIDTTLILFVTSIYLIRFLALQLYYYSFLLIINSTAHAQYKQFRYKTSEINLRLCFIKLHRSGNTTVYVISMF